MKSFLTGYRRLLPNKLGKPWQLVVRLEPAHYQRLLPVSDTHTLDPETNPFFWYHTIVLSQCHLICCLTDEQYEAWVAFTKACSRCDPLTKQAVMHLRQTHLGPFYD